jgi:S-adenosylmethionine/arginine decarboxylase-like enzyme
MSTVTEPATTEESGLGAAWGLSTSIDLSDCNAATIRDRELIQRFVIELCTLIDMRRYGECQIVNFGEGRVAGFSMLQLIETSLISAHFANESNRAYLDVFSCKAYDPDLVAEFSRQFFGASSFALHSTRRY